MQSGAPVPSLVGSGLSSSRIWDSRKDSMPPSFSHSSSLDLVNLTFTLKHPHGFTFLNFWEN